MARTVTTDQMAQALGEILEEYKDASMQKVKKAVRKSASRTRKEISEHAPVGPTGEYAKSWRVKTVQENSDKLVQVVYSPKRYMLAHLLEKGHAMRNGGRTTPKPHIAPAEKVGTELLETLVKKELGEG